MNKQFSISEAISFGWSTFKSNWKFWIVVFMIANMGLSSSLNSTNDKNKEDTTIQSNNRLEQRTNITNDVKQVLGVSDKKTNLPTALLVVLVPYGFITLAGFVFFIMVAMAIRNVILMGNIHLQLDAARGNPLSYKTLLSDVSLRKALRLYAVSFLYILLVFVGLLLLIIPGLYFAYKYYFAVYFFIDKNVGIRESFKLSAAATKGNKLKLFSLSIVSVFVIILGLLVFIVGVVPASIVVSLASTYAYATLSDQPADVSSQVVPEMSALA